MSATSLSSRFQSMDFNSRRMIENAITLGDFLDQYLDLSKNDTWVNKELLTNLFSLLDQDSKERLKEEICIQITASNRERGQEAAEMLLKQFAKNPFFEQEFMTEALLQAVEKQDNQGYRSDSSEGPVYCRPMQTQTPVFSDDDSIRTSDEEDTAGPFNKKYLIKYLGLVLLL
ncbi:MAG: hypothetical protein K1000chlam2_01587 [Chlamydiae bacterium]|nr:hypothetical protein [Chlamydiota bacterium]